MGGTAGLFGSVVLEYRNYTGGQVTRGRGDASVSDWQMIATGLCIAWAISVVVRRSLALGRSPEKSGCGSGCSTCPTNTNADAGNNREHPGGSESGFVPLESLQPDDR